MEIIEERIAGTVDGAAAVLTDTGDVVGTYVIRVVPRRTTSAPVTVFVDRSVESATVLLGEDTRFELFENARSRRTDRSIVDEINDLVAAAVAGNFSETTWRRGEAVIRSKGSVRIGGKTVTARRTVLGSRVLGTTTKITRVYDPYLE